uniref:NADH-ubiquinone oxidoreductase chain 1 n=2 Tax=Hemitheconyx caudicinctus TaxID=96741 RepID=I7H7L3_9SAUR|nr:NADH dehydrogenase subunit 1 [Hemitheconyx caudicinctus]BAM34420.1 NADH dehydrogenase subunit 1 [Hemitheconyx caudicinctus]
MTHLVQIISTLTMILPILAAVAFLTLLERKLIGHMQSRKGPNLAGPTGLLQPMADGIKLLTKEPTRPSTSSPALFVVAPTMALILALVIWAPIPMPTPLADMNTGTMFVLATSGLMVYTILWSGWASNSKYALLGTLRAVAQTISYEVTLAIILITTVMLTGGLSLTALATTQESTYLALPLWPLTIMWYISTLAETNRAPFDLTEGESELVSGFNVEYAAGPFALFFLAEYANILMMNTLTCTLFFNPGSTQQMSTITMMTETCTLTLGFLWIRTSYPRFRYDQLMYLTWKSFLPLTLALLMSTMSIMTATAAISPQT